MLDTALLFFQEELNNYLKIKTGGQGDEIVRFAQIQLPKTLTLSSGAITALLINLEEERLLRSSTVSSNRLLSRDSIGSGQNLLPLNFHVLFIANFNTYLQSLQYLSLTLKFFRGYRLFTRQRFPSLSPDIQQLSTELVNLTVTEQGELWRSLDLPCNPSALYKVKMLILQDSDIDEIELGGETRSIEIVTASV